MLRMDLRRLSNALALAMESVTYPVYALNDLLNSWIAATNQLGCFVVGLLHGSAIVLIGFQVVQNILLLGVHELEEFGLPSVGYRQPLLHPRCP